MRNKIMIGDRFGRLTIISKIQDDFNKRGHKRICEKWLCICECGARREVFKVALLRKKEPTLSCGCYARDRITATNFKHGGTYTRLFSIWSGMKTRCLNSNSDKAKHYHDRGIKVHPDWASDFRAFEMWAHNNGYSDELTIDRIDVNGDYSPENCRFVDAGVQANNRTNNKVIVSNGIRLTYSEWGKIAGSQRNRSLISQRLRRGWSEHEAVATPVGEKRGCV